MMKSVKQYETKEKLIVKDLVYYYKGGDCVGLSNAENNGEMFSQ